MHRAYGVLLLIGAWILILQAINQFMDDADDQYSNGRDIGYSDGWEKGYRAGLPPVVYREPETSTGVHLPTE